MIIFEAHLRIITNFRFHAHGALFSQQFYETHKHTIRSALVRDQRYICLVCYVWSAEIIFFYKTGLSNFFIDQKFNERNSDCRYRMLSTEFDDLRYEELTICIDEMKKNLSEEVREAFMSFEKKSFFCFAKQDFVFKIIEILMTALADCITTKDWMLENDGKRRMYIQSNLWYQGKRSIIRWVFCFILHAFKKDTRLSHKEHIIIMKCQVKQIDNRELKIWKLNISHESALPADLCHKIIIKDLEDKNDRSKQMRLGSPAKDFDESYDYFENDHEYIDKYESEKNFTAGSFENCGYCDIVILWTLWLLALLS